MSSYYESPTSLAYWSWALLPLQRHYATVSFVCTSLVYYWVCVLASCICQSDVQSVNKSGAHVNTITCKFYVSSCQQSAQSCGCCFAASAAAADERRQVLLQAEPIEQQIFVLGYAIWCVLAGAGRGCYARWPSCMQIRSCHRSAASSKTARQLTANSFTTQRPSALAIKFIALGSTYLESIINIIIIDGLWCTCGLARRINWFDRRWWLLIDVVKYKENTKYIDMNIYCFFVCVCVCVHK